MNLDLKSDSKDQISQMQDPACTTTYLSLLSQTPITFLIRICILQASLFEPCRTARSLYPSKAKRSKTTGVLLFSSGFGCMFVYVHQSGLFIRMSLPRISPWFCMSSLLCLPSASFLQHSRTASLLHLYSPLSSPHARHGSKFVREGSLNNVMKEGKSGYDP
jgi:hypothetical protein